MSLFKRKHPRIVDVKVIPVKKCIAIYDGEIESVSHLRIVTYEDSGIQSYPIIASQAHGVAYNIAPSVEGTLYRLIPEVYFNSVSAGRLFDLAHKESRGLSKLATDYSNLCDQVIKLGLKVTK